MSKYYEALVAKHDNQIPIILDSGVATELERRGTPMRPGQWAGCASIDDYEALVQTHLAYIEAGADVITINSYASSRLMLEPAGLGDQVQEINQRNIAAAMEARNQAQAPVAIAGSLSHVIPFQEGAEGAKQQPPISEETLSASYQELITLFEKEGLDLLLLEMMSLPSRMIPLFECAQASSLPVWCGLSARRPTPHAELESWHDSSVSFEAITELAASYHFEGMGIMHTAVDAIADCLALIQRYHSGILAAYPDSGFFAAPHWHFEEIIPPDQLLEFAQQWQAQGCSVFGGCCGLGPEHTHKLCELRNPAPAARPPAP